MNTTEFTLSNPRISKTGGSKVTLRCPVKYNMPYSGAEILLQTPLIFTWGISESVDGNKNPNGKFELCLQFPSSEHPNEEAELFLKELIKFNDQVVNKVADKSVMLFDKQKSKEVILDGWISGLRYPYVKGTKQPDNTKAPTLRVKIPKYDDEWSISIFDVNQKLIWDKSKIATEECSPLTLIPKYSKVAAVLRGVIWIINGKPMFSWQFVQAITIPPEQNLNKCLLNMSITDNSRAADAELNDNFDCELKPACDDEAEQPITTTSDETTMVADSDDETAEQTNNVSEVVVNPIAKSRGRAKK